MSEHGYCVGFRPVKVSADAARSTGSPYLEGEPVPVRFSDTVPGGIEGVRPSVGDETVFDTEGAAEAAARELLARNDLRRRVERGFIKGLAASLRPVSIGGGELGGWCVIDRSALVAAREAEAKMREAKTRARVAEAEAKADKARAEADHIRQELAAQEPTPTGAPGGEWVRHAGEGGIQERRKKDGSIVYRARKAGKISPSFITLEAAIEWRDSGGLPPEPEPVPAPARVVTVVDPETLGLPT